MPENMINESSTDLGKRVAAYAGRDALLYLAGYRLAVEAFYRELNRLKQEDFGAERPAAVLIERARSAIKGMNTEAVNLMRRVEDYGPGITVAETHAAGWGMRCELCDDTVVGLDEPSARALGRSHAADERHRVLATWSAS